MKLNIFKINIDKLSDFKEKLLEAGNSLLFEKNNSEWRSEMFFSENPEDIEIPWLKYFKDDITRDNIRNKMYYGVFIWSNLDNCFAVTYGKSHYFAKMFCETGFGLNLATRIADHNDIRQKSVRKFGGRNTKAINSYQKETLLDLNVNESVDYINAKIVDDLVKNFSKQAKFGDSLLITKDISWDDFGIFLNNIVHCLSERPRFELPKVKQVKDDIQIQHLLDELKSFLLHNDNSISLAEDSYSMIGVDFNFNNADKYELYFKKSYNQNSMFVESLELKNIVEFVKSSGADIFEMKIKFISDNRTTYSKEFKNIIDYTHPKENIMFKDGVWYTFNEEFVSQLNDFVNKIQISKIDEFQEIDKIKEDAFNKLLAEKYNYINFDKNLSYIDGHAFEAWDLVKDGTAYAVKFGSAQKLSYVFDQAKNTINMLTNKVLTNKGFIYENIKINKYCVWLGFERNTKLETLSSVESLIFKQKAVEWFRACNNLGIKSEIKISYINS